MLRPAVYLWLAASACAAQLSLQWEREIPASPRGLYSAVVCPGGGYYFSDGTGRVTMLSAGGRAGPAPGGGTLFERAWLVACDPGGSLYVADRTGITVAGVHDLRTLRHLDTPVVAGHMAFGRDGKITVVGQRPGSRLPLHALKPDGSVRFSFGEPESDFIVPRRPPEGFVFPAAESGGVVFVPRLEYELRIYDADGRLVDVRQRPGRPGAIRPAENFPGSPGDVKGAAALPDGGLAVQVRAPFEGDGPPFTIDLWTRDLRPDGSAPSLAGWLTGADADGNLYFTSFGDAGRVTVRKAAIKKPGGGKFLARRK